MTTIVFLAEWAVRSSTLVILAALLLYVLRVKSSSMRLAVWTTVLCASLALPALRVFVPSMPLVVMRAQPAKSVVDGPVSLRPLSSRPAESIAAPVPAVAPSFDWKRAAIWVYALITAALLLRVFASLAMNLRLLRASVATGRRSGASEIRVSGRVMAPVTLGIVHPAIVLPQGWREWDEAKLEAVLVHEQSHIDRKDPVVQLLSAIHQALLWHSPLSWVLHRRIVRVAEDASDDAAIAVTSDRAFYAEVLLDFMRRGVRGVNIPGVAMARYARPDDRIHRILNNAAIARGVTRWSIAMMLVFGVPLTYVVAATRPQRAPQTPAAPRAVAAPVMVAAVSIEAAPALEAAPTELTAEVLEEPQSSEPIRRYMIFLGDSTSGSWDSRDPVDRNDLRARFGNRFVWFRQGGHEYVVTDPGVMAQLESAMAPQREVNAMQSEVNAAQANVNALQSGVNRQQNDVNALQRQVNQLQDMVNRLQSGVNNGSLDDVLRKLEDDIKKLRESKNAATQGDANRAQAKVNEAQSKVNDEQHKVNAMQQKVNDAQHQATVEFNRDLQTVLESAIDRHLAQQIK
jgi:beta-lactamase regulating signal transducer with metallopeptidase domain